MLTRTREIPQQQIPETTKVETIAKAVDERGFYLYEWISQDELRTTLDNDYLKIVRYGSIPLAIVSVIAGFIGYMWGLFGSILAILMVLWLFYFFVLIILSIKFFYNSYLYTRGANVVITDDHYVQWGNIFEHEDKQEINEHFGLYEKTFDERFLGASGLAKRKQTEQKALFDNLKDIATGWGKMIEGIWHSRDAGGIVIVIILAGLLYGLMMGTVYFIGMFFIAIFGRIFSLLAHWYLLATSNTEQTIQTLFASIDESAKKLEWEKNTIINLLDDAVRDEWKEDLLGKINESTELLGEIARDATKDTIKLRTILESSKYKDIFNFVKYGNWVKKQILEPIESILLLLKKNRDTIEKTIASLNAQIAGNPPSKGGQGGNVPLDPSLQKPLELQRERLNLQKKSFEQVMEMLEGYKVKLS